MSASQDKKKRQTERAEGTEKRLVAERQKQEEQHKSKVRWTVGSIIVAVFVALILLVNSTLFYTALPAVKVSGESYNNAEYQYYFKSAYYRFCNQYSDYLSYFLDVNSPLGSQQCAFNEEQTWAEYFRETALTNMTETTALYKAAVAEGYTLSEENAAAIDEEIAALETSAASQGFSSVKNYLSAVYGKGCTEKTVRKLMNINYIASDYALDHQKAFTYTDEQYETWYEENKDTYDLLDYVYYYVAAETVETTEDVKNEETGETTPQTTSAPTEETMAAAKATADEIAARAVDRASFEAAVAELIPPTVTEATETTEETVTPATVTAAEGTQGGNVDTNYSAWLLDSARTAGNVTVSEVENGGYNVVMFLGRNDNHYPTANFRHILKYVTDQDENGELSDSEKVDAENSVKNIETEWKTGAATEESFAELANKYSDDPGSNTTGGLYEDVYKGRMVASINEFLFEDGRKPGDTTICYNEGSYTGYHLVYYVGPGMLYSDYLADQALRSEDYTAWQATVTEGVEAEQAFAFRFAEEG